MVFIFIFYPAKIRLSENNTKWNSFFIFIVERKYLRGEGLKDTIKREQYKISCTFIFIVDIGGCLVSKHQTPPQNKIISFITNRIINSITKETINFVTKRIINLVTHRIISLPPDWVTECTRLSHRARPIDESSTPSWWIGHVQLMNRPRSVGESTTVSWWIDHGQLMNRPRSVGESVASKWQIGCKQIVNWLQAIYESVASNEWIIEAKV